MFTHTLLAIKWTELFGDRKSFPGYSRPQITRGKTRPHAIGNQLNWTTQCNCKKELIMSPDMQRKNGGLVDQFPQLSEHISLRPHPAQDRGSLTGEVGQDDVCPGSPEAHERFHHHLLLVNHAQGTSSFDHGVLTRNLKG
jgi:hypothetical protein